MQYKSLLELKYIKRTKVVAFADDLIIATRGELVRTVENYVNVELSKINVGQRITRHDLTTKIQSNASFKKEKERKQEHNSLLK